MKFWQDHEAPTLAIENNLFRRSPLSSFLVDSDACMVRIRPKCRGADGGPSPGRDHPGRNSVRKILDTTVLVPIFVVGLIAVPFYRWIANKLVRFIEDRDHQV
jgi:hypothetical protein